MDGLNFSTYINVADTTRALDPIYQEEREEEDVLLDHWSITLHLLFVPYPSNSFI